MPPHGTGGSWKKNDLVFRRIGRLKSKTLPTWSIWSYHQHTQLEAKFNRKMKQHQCVQFDFCRIFTGKNYPNPCPNPTSLLKSLVYLWVFFVEADSKNPTKPPQQQLQFRSHQPPQRRLDGFHNTSYLAGFDKRQVKSTTETSGVGTRKAMLASGAGLEKAMRNETEKI